MADPTTEITEITAEQIRNAQTYGTAIDKLAVSIKNAATASGRYNEEQEKSIKVLIDYEKAGGKLTASQKALTSQFSDITKKLSESAAAAGSFFSNLFGGKDVLDSIVEKVDKWKNSNENIINSLYSSYVSVDAFRKNVFATVPALAQMQNEVKGNSELISKFGNDFNEAIKKMQLLPPALAGLPDIAKNFIDNIALTNAFETSILRLTNSGGSASSMMKLLGRDGGNLSENLDQAQRALIARASDLGISTGIGFKEAMDNVKSVMSKLPSELNQIYTISKVRGQDYALTTEQLLSKVAAGVGIETSKAIEVTSNMFATFGKKIGAAGIAETASTRLAVMGKAAKDLQIPFEGISKLIENLDSKFELWGDQALGTMDILRNVSSALEGSGVGFKGQISIVDKLTGAFANMSFGMKSFIGIQNGLQGGAVSAGLKIEKMMQDGKMGELVGMMQDTLQKATGSAAVTLGQAAENPQVENVFLRQRAMLKAMGVEGDAAQNRILETMSKVKLGAVTGEDAGQVFKEALATGEDLQKKQSLDIAVIKDNTESAANALSAIAGADTGRKAFSDTEFMKKTKENIQYRQVRGEAGTEDQETAQIRIGEQAIRTKAEQIVTAARGATILSKEALIGISNIINSLGEDSQTEKANLKKLAGSISAAITNAENKYNEFSQKFEIRRPGEAPSNAQQVDADKKKAAQTGQTGQRNEVSISLGEEPQSITKRQPLPARIAKPAIKKPTTRSAPRTIPIPTSTTLKSGQIKTLRDGFERNIGTSLSIDKTDAGKDMLDILDKSKDFTKTKTALIVNTFKSYNEVERKIRQDYKDDKNVMNEELNKALQTRYNSLEFIGTITHENVKTKIAETKAPEPRKLKINETNPETEQQIAEKFRDQLIPTDIKAPKLSGFDFYKKRDEIKEKLESEYNTKKQAISLDNITNDQKTIKQNSLDAEYEKNRNIFDTYFKGNNRESIEKYMSGLINTETQPKLQLPGQTRPTLREKTAMSGSDNESNIINRFQFDDVTIHVLDENNKHLGKVTAAVHQLANKKVQPA